MGVRDPRYYLKVLYGCKRPAVSSEKFCMGVRDPWYCKTQEKSNFMKNGKMVISVKIRNFSRS